MLHVLPKGFYCIRHYGLLARGAAKAHTLARVRELIAASRPQEPLTPKQQDTNNSASSADRPILPCPCCGGRMIIIETFEADTTPRLPNRTSHRRHVIKPITSRRIHLLPNLHRWYLTATPVLRLSNHLQRKIPLNWRVFLPCPPFTSHLRSIRVRSLQPSPLLPCSGRASQIPKAPAEPGACLSRLRSLKAFGRRPTGLGASGKLSERAGSPKPVTKTAVTWAVAVPPKWSARHR
jgi:hypothetical protein